MTPTELSAARHELHLTLTQAAHALGVARSTYCRWEANQARIPASIELALEALRTRQEAKP